MGRPPSRAVVLRDGFYIQVRNKGASSGVKIRATDSKSMLESAAEYMKSKEKEVLVLGELKKGIWLNEQASTDEKRKAKAMDKAKNKLLAKAKEKPKEKPKEKLKEKPKEKPKAKAKVKSKSK